MMVSKIWLRELSIVRLPPAGSVRGCIKRRACSSGGDRGRELLYKSSRRRFDTERKVTKTGSKRMVILF